MRGEVGPINMATVLFTVVLVKPRETLPEPERSPLGGEQCSFSFRASTPCSLLSRPLGATRKLNYMKSWQVLFIAPTMQRAAKAKATIPLTDPFTCPWEGGQVAGGSPVQMKIRAGKVKELQPHLGTFERGGLFIYVYSFDLFTFIWHHSCTPTAPVSMAKRKHVLLFK